MAIYFDYSKFGDFIRYILLQFDIFIYLFSLFFFIIVLNLRTFK